MRLNQNMESLNVYKNYSKNLKIQSKAMERISSGSKINSTKDDPNKMGVREGLRMQIRGLQSAQRNIQDGISMFQSTDGTLSSINESLIRMKELTVQAGGTTSDDDLKIIQNEINQIKDSIDQMAENSEFNGVKLLVGPEGGSLNHMVGSNSGEDMKIPLFNVKTSNLKDEFGNSLKDLDIIKNDGISEGLGIIEGAIEKVTSVRSKYGSLQNRMETTYENIEGNSASLVSAESKVGDADIALEMAEYARTSIISESSLAILNQTNNFPKDILRVLENMR
ncbi:flagellin [Clostridium sp.]|uniref:flagellin N-terminal helical domain-containing protein n=1 Tax=Clostridium sp. TaxID=1506 RepID=UPI00260595BD|nr:flagellin [Clostridium sp.]